MYKNVIEKNINQYSHEEFCELIELSVRKKVIYNPQLKSFEIYSDDNELESVINKLNFNEFREIVMNQNLLYEPIIAPTKQAQKYIDAKLSNTNGVEFKCTKLGVNSVEYFTKRKARDEKAREVYLKGTRKSATLTNDIFVVDIMRKGLKDGDPII